MDKRVITISRIGIYSMVVMSMIYFTLTNIMAEKTVPTGKIINAAYITKLSQHSMLTELNKASIPVFILIVLALVLLKIASILSNEYTTSTIAVAVIALLTALATIPFCLIVMARNNAGNWSVSSVYVKSCEYSNINNVKRFFVSSREGEKFETTESVYDKVLARGDYNIWVIRHDGAVIEVHDPANVTVTQDALSWSPER